MPRRTRPKLSARSKEQGSSSFRSIVVFLLSFTVVYGGVIQLFPSDAAIVADKQSGLVPYLTAYGVWIFAGWAPCATLAFLVQEAVGTLGGFGHEWQSVAARHFKAFLICVFLFLILPVGGAIGFKLTKTYRSKNGPQREYYSDGSLNTLKTLKNGIPHGIETAWDTKGNKTLELFYANGKLDGIETRWDDSQMVLRGTWKEGLRSGIWEEWHLNGKPKSHGEYAVDTDSNVSNRNGRWTTWADNGQKTSEGDYVMGARSGPWAEWYASGQKKLQGQYGTEKLSDGSEAVDRRIGIWTEWHENGQPKSKGEWANGAEQGEWQEWFDDGQKHFEGMRVDGRGVSGTSWNRNGEIARTFKAEKDANGETITKIKVYHPNGKLRATFAAKLDGKSHGPFEAWSSQGAKQVAGSFLDGEKNGVWTYWDANGKELGQETWDKGKLKTPSIAKPQAAQQAQQRRTLLRRRQALARANASKVNDAAAAAKEGESEQAPNQGDSNALDIEDFQIENK